MGSGTRSIKARSIKMRWFCYFNFFQILYTQPVFPGRLCESASPGFRLISNLRSVYTSPDIKNRMSRKFGGNRPGPGVALPAAIISLPRTLCMIDINFTELSSPADSVSNGLHCWAYFEVHKTTVHQRARARRRRRTLLRPAASLRTRSRGIAPPSPL